MEDYFCLTKNVKTARLYVEYLNKKLRGEEVRISFVSEDYDLYESYPIEDYGNRFDVSIIPSILFKSKDDISIIVFNPKQDAMDLLEDVKTEKSYRLINILYGLSDKFSIHISPNQILEKLEKSDLSDIYLTKDNDILELIVDLKYCDNIKEAESKFFNMVRIPRLLLPYNSLIKKLSSENELYVVDPDYFIDAGKNFKFLKGFILNYKNINNNIKDTCLMNSLDLRFGSGRLID